MLNKSIPWATVMIVVLVSVAALVGGAVVIWGPDGALSFQDYLDLLQKFAIAAGILGIGRGVKAGLENHALMSAPLSVEIPAQEDGSDGSVATAKALGEGGSHV